MKRRLLQATGLAVVALVFFFVIGLTSYARGWRPAVVDSVPFSDAREVVSRLTEYREATGALPHDLVVLGRKDVRFKAALEKLNKRGDLTYNPRASGSLPQMKFRMELRQARGPFIRHLPIELLWRFPGYLEWRQIGSPQ
jgi:hypothetical protein